jgi:hypothetical protein
MLNPEHTSAEDVRAGLQSAQRSASRQRVIAIISAWALAKERYADLHSRARTSAASELVFRIYGDIAEHEQKTGDRVRKRRVRSGVKFADALERFIGDLLRVRARTTAPALVYRAVGKSSFTHDPVKYDVFIRALEGLKALELVGHQRGRTRYRKADFGPDAVLSVAMRGRAARFWATGKLLTLAAQFGIDSSNVDEHFTPEPPKHPLVLRDYASGRGRNREQGRKVEFKRTPETERLEKDVRELNEFLARFTLTGGTHYGYTRVFNNLSWKAGGRLWSAGEHSYQQLPELERLKMTINGEPVAEIDIKASQLTIYHPMVGEPLDGSSDPYARVGLDRTIVKKWTVISFGNGAPATRWPRETIEDYKRETGKDLGKQAKAKDVAERMLETFPALRKLGHNSELWADLQFREAEAVIGTMLILKRKHGVPSYSMHDGIIVPWSQARLAKRVLMGEFHRVVGVEPMLTVEPDVERILEEAADL